MRKMTRLTTLTLETPTAQVSAHLRQEVEAECSGSRLEHEALWKPKWKNSSV